MLGLIEGEVRWKDERSVIVSASGVGYLIAATTRTLSIIKEGERIALWTHLAVREDALDLYGFTRRDELEFFKLLIAISGIGPKSALNILSLADVATLARAISSGDGSYLTKVSGIGKKLAEKIVLELREKAGQFSSDTEVSDIETEALDALEALGYAPRDTRDVVRSFALGAKSSQEIIRSALKALGTPTK